MNDGGIYICDTTNRIAKRVFHGPVTSFAYQIRQTDANGSQAIHFVLAWTVNGKDGIYYSTNNMEDSTVYNNGRFTFQSPVFLELDIPMRFIYLSSINCSNFMLCEDNTETIDKIYYISYKQPISPPGSTVTRGYCENPFALKEYIQSVPIYSYNNGWTKTSISSEIAIQHSSSQPTSVNHYISVKNGILQIALLKENISGQTTDKFGKFDASISDSGFGKSCNGVTFLPFYGIDGLDTESNSFFGHIYTDSQTVVSATNNGKSCVNSVFVYRNKNNQYHIAQVETQDASTLQTTVFKLIRSTEQQTDTTIRLPYGLAIDPTKITDYLKYNPYIGLITSQNSMANGKNYLYGIGNLIITADSKSDILNTEKSIVTNIDGLSDFILMGSHNLSENSTYMICTENIVRVCNGSISIMSIDTPIFMRVDNGSVPLLCTSRSVGQLIFSGNTHFDSTITGVTIDQIYLQLNNIESMIYDIWYRTQKISYRPA